MNKENNTEKLYKYNEAISVLMEPDFNNSDSQNFPQKTETYQIIGACMEVHNELGRGFHEIVYKDALEVEFKLQEIPYVREKPFNVLYKGFNLDRNYNADFCVFGNIILEIKADQADLDTHADQILNYLAVSKCKIALFVNFGNDKLIFKRVIL